MKRVLLLFSLLMFSFFSTSNNLYADAMREMYLPVGFTNWTYGFDWLSPDDPPYSYGCSGGSVYHPGIDINKACSGGGDCEKGEWLPVYAIADGEVVFADDSVWTSIIIEHDYNGQKTYSSAYGHSRITPMTADESPYGKADTSFTKVKVGDTVSAGQQIGYVWDNNTGPAHLHFEVRKSSHPNANGTAFCSILGGASRDDVKDWYVNPVDFVKSEGYIDGHCLEIESNFSKDAVICWFDPDDSENSSCKDGVAHKIYQKGNKGMIASYYRLDDRTIESYCENTISDSSVDIIDFLSNKSFFVPGGGDSGGGCYSQGCFDEGHEEEDFTAYKHRVSMKYLRGSIHDRDKYRRTLTFVYGQSSTIDLEAKVKNKYETPIEDVRVDYYYSPNRWFSTTHDEKLESDKISKIKGGKSVKKHLRDIDISGLEPGKHYFFINIRWANGHNISSRNDETEYVMVRILPPAGPIIVDNPDLEDPSNGSFPIFKVEEGGYYTKYTLNPDNPDTAEIIGYAFAEPQLDTVPIHEFDSGKQYFYVATDWERDNVFEDKDWDYLGVVFYAYPAGSTEGEPFWRSWHYASETHDWTADLSLRNYWETSGSHRSEGNAWQILNPIY